MVDHVGAFLHSQFNPGEEVYIQVPEGMKHHYPANKVLLLTKTLYGLKQSAIQYWKETRKCFADMGYKRSWRIHVFLLSGQWLD